MQLRNLAGRLANKLAMLENAAVERSAGNNWTHPRAAMSGIRAFGTAAFYCHDRTLLRFACGAN